MQIYEKQFTFPKLGYVILWDCCDIRATDMAPRVAGRDTAAVMGAIPLYNFFLILFQCNQIVQQKLVSSLYVKSFGRFHSFLIIFSFCSMYAKYNCKSAKAGIC